MKYFFYTILLVASLGTIGAMVNPSLVQQGAAFLGLELPQNADDSNGKNTSEDQLAKFLEQYQYPFSSSQRNSAVPTTTLPMVVTPEPTPQFHVAPATPFPKPVAETSAPAYVQPVYAEPAPPVANWDSEAVTPIYPPPAFEYHLPHVPAQEPVFAPQQSVYAVAPVHYAPPTPPQNAFTAFEHTAPSDFTPTSYVPPMPQQPTYPPQLTHLTQTPYPQATTTLHTSAVLIEEVPMYGTETVARVGTQVLLMGDILPKLRRTALKMVALHLEKMPEEKRAEVTREEIEKNINAVVTNLYPEVLQDYILLTLVYNDYVLQQKPEMKNAFDEKLGEEFNRKEIPEMLKEFNVENEAALKRFLERQLGSSLEKERRLWIWEQIARQWNSMSIQRATADATQDEMMHYYERNQAMFTTSARARWQEMVVLFSRHKTEREAEHKMRWMGNQVANGRPFEEIARTESDGFTASEGGVWDWTTKGSLTSAELEQAIFSQPIRQLSPRIIKSDRGFHIIRVLEREEEKVMPFGEAQVAIREKIKNQRIQQFQVEYLTDLRRRFPIEVVRERIDFDTTNPRTASNVR